jgi:hypothetical protein
MKYKILIFISYLLFQKLVFSQTDSKDPIATAFKSGQTKEIAKYFDSSVSLKILEKEDLYSKSQAELILKDFFTKYPFKNYAAKHNGVSKNGAIYNIGTLTTSNKNFRTSYFIKKQGDFFILQELRIENED